MDPMTTIIDVFLINLDKHLQPNQQPGGHTSQGLYPVIHTNQIITEGGNSYQVEAFDFATLTFNQLDTAITILCNNHD